jgi:hypothetical protein
MTKYELKSFVCATFDLCEDKWFDYEDEFIALAEMIAANERESCAKICDQVMTGCIKAYADAIRARGYKRHD